MPYKIHKSKNCYKVINEHTGRVFSKCTTKDKASRQIRLLRSLEHKGGGERGFFEKVWNKIINLFK